MNRLDFYFIKQYNGVAMQRVRLILFMENIISSHWTSSEIMYIQARGLEHRLVEGS